jgi:two-component system, oxyanion-binding sensor
MVRWGQAPIPPDAVRTAQAVFRPDLYDDALGRRETLADAPGDAMGAFTGPAFQADDVAGYLASFSILRRPS